MLELNFTLNLTLLPNLSCDLHGPYPYPCDHRAIAGLAKHTSPPTHPRVELSSFILPPLPPERGPSFASPQLRYTRRVDEAWLETRGADEPAFNHCRQMSVG
ncbi:MAG: hypothetical protein HYR94_26245 [Chloroflexi bacterium]|nr:hypothetical protein [Chloroflexota bacterium]